MVTFRSRPLAQRERGIRKRCAATLAAASLAAALVGPASGATLVVLNKAEATASLIDLDSGNVVATLPTGNGPHEAAVSPDGSQALATNYGTGAAPGSTLTLIDVPGGRVAKTIDLGENRRPHGVRWLDDRRAAVTAEGSKMLLVVDVVTGKVETVIATGQEVSHMVALSPDRSRAFVANIGSGTMTALDLRERKILQHVPTGKGAEGIDVTPDGRQVWVTNREADSVSVVDASSLQVLATLESKAFPIRAKVTPDGRHVLVSNARSSDVAVFDAKTHKELRRIKTGLVAGSAGGRVLGFAGGVPIGIVISPDGKRAYVAHANADAIAILDLDRWAAIGTLKAGKEPDGMAYSPARAQP